MLLLDSALFAFLNDICTFISANVLLLVEVTENVIYVYLLPTQNVFTITANIIQPCTCIHSGITIKYSMCATETGLLLCFISH